jgi:hypothetical protein
VTMMNEFYQLELSQRRRLLADEGFVRDWTRIWKHPDGRAVGEGVAAALTDEAFCRFLGIGVPREHADEWAEQASA